MALLFVTSDGKAYSDLQFNEKWPMKAELYNYSDDIVKIFANGEHLQKCCNILGRNLPPTDHYIFTGNNAKEIALNWY